MRVEEMEEKKQNPDLSQIIQCLLIDTVLFEGGLTILDHIVHDALVHATL